jgi:acyl-CoA synthetase (AMP-forming)/AMP-acid ligase II
MMAKGLDALERSSAGGESAELQAVENLYDRMDPQGLGRVPRAAVVAIPFLMFDHFGGFNTILAITSSLGTVVSVVDRSVARVCGAIEKYRVTLLPTTPSFLNLMMAAKAHESFELGSLQRITYGTEVMPQATLDRLAKALPKVVLQQTYGLSEVGVLASKSRDEGTVVGRQGGSVLQGDMDTARTGVDSGRWQESIQHFCEHSGNAFALIPGHAEVDQGSHHAWVAAVVNAFQRKNDIQSQIAGQTARTDNFQSVFKEPDLCATSLDTVVAVDHGIQQCFLPRKLGVFRNGAKTGSNKP